MIHAQPKPLPPAAPAIDPTPVMRLSTAYWDSQTLLTANRLGLFTLLADGPLDGEAVARRLGTRPRPTGLLLKALVALGLLEQGAGGFANSALSAAYLVAGRPGYLGDAIRYSDNLYRPWAALEETLRDGVPAMAPAEYLGSDPEKTRAFVYGMHERALSVGRALVAIVDLSGRRRLLDIGGGPGTYAALFAERYPELTARVIDLPGVVAIAHEILGRFDVGGRVSEVPGDYRTAPFPSGNDVVLISGVFHRETPASCQDLIRRGSGALQPGGLLVVSDVLTDAGGASPAFAALFGLNMMLSAVDGGVHADEDVADWMADAGLTAVEILPFPPPMPHRIVIGRKP
jgi:SAM-dependent methyltransferase